MKFLSTETAQKKRPRSGIKFMTLISPLSLQFYYGKETNRECSNFISHLSLIYILNFVMLHAVNVEVIIQLM